MPKVLGGGRARTHLQTLEPFISATHYTMSLTRLVALKRLGDTVAYFLCTGLNNYLLCWIINCRRAGALSSVFTTAPVVSVDTWQ